MKNKLFYLISAACLLSYTGTFTSCVNGVDDEYLEQKITDNGKTNDEGEELPDLNGDYSTEGDFELTMTCNGEVLEGKKVILTTDENNETASITFSGGQVDLETAIAAAIPGGVGGLITGWGLKYTSYSPVPGEKEVTINDIPLYRNGTTYKFNGSHVQPTYIINYEGMIENEKMTISINYELTNQTLAGTWMTATKAGPSGDVTTVCSPLWIDWDSKVGVSLGKVSIVTINEKPMNGIFSLLSGPLSKTIMGQLGIKEELEIIVRNLLESVTAEPNGGMFASYSYGTDLTQPGPYSTEMPHNAVRYYYDPITPDSRIFMEINGGFLIDMIKSLASVATSTTRSTPTTRDLRDTAKELIALLVPVLEKGIPCDYTLDGNNLTINIDGVLLRDVLLKLMEVITAPDAAGVVDGLLAGLGDFAPNIKLLLSTLPPALKYHDATTYDENHIPTDPTGECRYVKLGLKFVKAAN
ncbi:DUF4925 domain-containing protein [Bacteroides sp.]|uniref:DUF4925 domain-containing protein n=1 Tax=Bacteroides sp. TaxID=29523 RepID=UPI0025C4054F|nr:DUF4925 domain-containing protein [Bacteroides sp.]